MHGTAPFCGLDLDALIASARATSEKAAEYAGFDGSRPVEVVFDWRIRLLTAAERLTPPGAATQGEDAPT